MTEQSEPKTLRLTFGLTAFLTAILIGLCGLTFTLVSHVFDQFEHSVRQDLAWKALGGSHEIAAAAERAIRERDQKAVLGALGHYGTNSDVEAVVALDAAGGVVAAHGHAPEEVLGLFQGPPDTVVEGRSLRAWAPAVQDGKEVGRVAVSISPRRLDVLGEFRQRVLLLAGGGVVAALLASLLFATFYLGPQIKRAVEPPAPAEERPFTDESPDLARIAELERALAHASRRAEVANALGAPEILQEVGNALSGVNVSAALVADTVRGSRLAGLDKALALIETNADDLANFLATDPKGRRLPEYLRALGQAAADERAVIAREIASLQGKVARIKEIVGGRSSSDELDKQAG
jgi:hypothetical protein